MDISIRNTIHGVIFYIQIVGMGLQIGLGNYGLAAAFAAMAAYFYHTSD